MVCAALALPGVAGAQADAAPDEGRIAFRWLSYHDRQPGLDRIRVESPSLQLRAPLGSRWSIDATGTIDAVSGASPRYHTAISGASRMRDRRRAGELRLVRHDDRHAWVIGAATSAENDYRSRALSAEARVSSDDNNLSGQAGIAVTHDRIGSSDDPDYRASRRTLQWIAGATMALSRTDIAQLNLTHARGRGHFSDPYKALDQRPATRHQSTATLRWNHHVEPWHTTLRSSYRFYRDSFGVRAHTLGWEAVWAASSGLSLAPSLRLHTQTAARFYYDPVYSFLGAPYPPGYLDDPLRIQSADQRLSAFGAVTLGIKVGFALPQGWQAELQLDAYRQRSDWHLGGPGSPGLAPLDARFVQFGLARRF